MSDVNINSNGSDGGHKYIVSTIEFRGNRRRVSVFFQYKSDEAKLYKGMSLAVQGTLTDDGNDDLLMSNVIIVALE